MIHLKYGSTAMSFAELKFLSGITKTTITCTTLRQRLYQKSLSGRRYWTLFIAPAEINEQAKLSFLEAFFLSNDIYVSADNINWRKVIIDGDDNPFEYLEEVKFLPKFEVKLLSAEPDSSELTGWSCYG